MPDIIFITGCPTSGKSTIAKLLQEKLKSPVFEFGWIPEFKNLKINQTYEQEEEISFENLVLVTKNYIKHGYSNIILTDLSDKIFLQIPEIFKDYNYKIFTLILDTETIEIRISQRKIDHSGFDDFDYSLASNQFWIDSGFKNQTKVESFDISPEKIVEDIFKRLKR